MHRFKRIIPIFILLSFLLIPVSAENTAGSERRYGYQQLSTDAQRYAYDKIADGIRCFAETVQLDQGKGLTSEDIVFVRDMIYSDFPEYFWFRGSFDYSHTEQDIVVSFTPHYGVEINGQTITEANQLMRQASYRLDVMTQSILQTVKQDSDYEKARKLYAYVAALVDYESSVNDQNLYGAMIEGKSVCSGYARMYQHLLLQAGIDAWWVSGTAVNSKGVTENHAWNLLWLDGKCYYADITWDDGEEHFFHAYFLRSYEEFSKNHTPDENYAPLLPKTCEHTDLRYVNQYSGVNPGFGIAGQIHNSKELADAFVLTESSSENAVYFATIRYEGEDFSKWFHELFQQEILSLLGLKKANAEWAFLGDEYQVTISGTPKQVSQISVESVVPYGTEYQLGYSGQTLPILVDILPMFATNAQVVMESDNLSVVAIDVKTGFLTAVGEGSANISISIPGQNVSVTCKVTVATEPENYPEFPEYQDPEAAQSQEPEQEENKKLIPDSMIPGVIALVFFVLLSSLFRKR